MTIIIIQNEEASYKKYFILRFKFLRVKDIKFNTSYQQQNGKYTSMGGGVT